MTYYNNDTHELEIECEECGHTDAYVGTFEECIEEAKHDGWIVTKEGYEWLHYCGENCSAAADFK